MLEHTTGISHIELGQTHHIILYPRTGNVTVGKARILRLPGISHGLATLGVNAPVAVLTLHGIAQLQIVESSQSHLLQPLDHRVGTGKLLRYQQIRQRHLIGIHPGIQRSIGGDDTLRGGKGSFLIILVSQAAHRPVCGIDTDRIIMIREEIAVLLPGKPEGVGRDRCIAVCKLDLFTRGLVKSQVGKLLPIIGFQEGLRLGLGFRLTEHSFGILIPGDVGIEPLNIAGAGIHRESAGIYLFPRRAAVAKDAGHRCCLVPVRLPYREPGRNQLIAGKAILRNRTQSAVQLLGGEDPLHLGDPRLLRIGQGIPFCGGILGRSVVRPGAAHPHGPEHLLLQGSQIHQLAGLGIYIELVDRVRQVTKHRLGTVVIRKNVLQPQR